MAKLVWLSDDTVGFKCPGCRGPQQLPVKGPRAWAWNGSMDKPTFTPSILTTWTSGADSQKRICHSFVTDGHIKFLSDCTHKLAGQTIELSDVQTESDLFEKIVEGNENV